MKYIQKQTQPQALIAWVHGKSSNNQSIAWGYDDMPSDVRQAVKAHLIAEQGCLCCYTGRRITSDTAHIEHLKPQALCVGHEDTDYKNLLAAYPGTNTRMVCRYGAHAKKDWYDEGLFIHPLRPDCEERLRYNMKGRISASNPSDQGAVETIKRLCLDHSELTELRAQAIDEALFGPELNKSQVQRLMDEVDKRDSEGCFRQFCFVIKQACEKYLKRFS